MVHYAYLKIVAFEREQELREINLTEVGCKKMPVMEQQPFASRVKARADRLWVKVQVVSPKSVKRTRRRILQNLLGQAFARSDAM